MPRYERRQALNREIFLPERGHSCPPPVTNSQWLSRTIRIGNFGDCCGQECPRSGTSRGSRMRGSAFMCGTNLPVLKRMSIHHHAAIDGQYLARDVTGGGTGEEQGGVGDVLRLAEHVERNLLEYAIAGRFVQSG